MNRSVQRQWKPKRERVSHADDWLMTYADVITLLLCFLAVLLSISIAKKQLPPTPPQQKVTVQVTQPQVPPQEFKPLPTDPLRGDMPYYGVKHDDEITDEPDDEAPSNTTDASAATETPPPVAAGMSKPVAPLAEIINNMKSNRPEDNASLQQTGDRITTLEVNSAAFFASGSATLSAEGQAILRDVAANLKQPHYDGYQITVEGHTDDSPINTAQFPSNWELSTARAAAVTRFFLEQGIAPQKLRAAGYADTFPKAPNRDANGNAIPANQAQNRRVVIKLEKIEKAADASAPVTPGGMSKASLNQ